MLVIETVRGIVRDIGRMPHIVHVGMAVGLVAFTLDVVIHLAPAADHHHGFRPEEHLAHLAGLVAMTLVLVGVVVDGIRRQRAHRHHSQGDPGHAYR